MLFKAVIQGLRIAREYMAHVQWFTGGHLSGMNLTMRSGVMSKSAGVGAGLEMLGYINFHHLPIPGNGDKINIQSH